MHQPKLTVITGLLLALLSSGCQFIDLKPPTDNAVAQALSSTDQQAILAALKQAQVIYLGETHSSEADHAAQLQIIEALQANNPNLAIGFEMFQRPFQPILDRYIAGEISEEALRNNSEYDRRWGFPWEFYAPVLRLAQTQGLPILALNTPTEMTRKVAREGLASLAGSDFRYIPEADEILLEPEAYRQRVKTIYELAHQGHSASLNFENFFAAQVLWDETMADGIAQFLAENPDYQVVVLTGQGHVHYGHGIPSRVQRRLGAELKQHTVVLNPQPDIQQAGEAIADFFWFSEAADRRDAEGQGEPI